ncbi:hypothetical protein ABEB36_008653 [Hypothenemus hampei]|uniref:Uncharacterized protein n=1 Tax=Hypothenemus hampei TaxID=57062 RepID=A0ABD1EMM1_HYPHA
MIFINVTLIMDKEINENFIKKEANTEFDAIHPRFQPEDEEVALKYQQQNYYFCGQCNIFFAPTVRGLNIHFKGDMVKHSSCGSCFYCHGELCENNIL